MGSCSFVDVLEEAVLVKRPVAIEMRDGTTFIDQVTDVTTESGQDFAVFRSHARVPVREIAAANACRAAPPAVPTRSLTAETAVSAGPAPQPGGIEGPPLQADGRLC